MQPDEGPLVDADWIAFCDSMAGKSVDEIKAALAEQWPGREIEDSFIEAIARGPAA